MRTGMKGSDCVMTKRLQFGGPFHRMNGPCPTVSRLRVPNDVPNSAILTLSGTRLGDRTPCNFRQSEVAGRSRNEGVPGSNPGVGSDSTVIAVAVAAAC